MRLFTRTETVTTTDEWGVPVTTTETHLSWLAARRERRAIEQWRREAAAADARAAASEDW